MTEKAAGKQCQACGIRISPDGIESTTYRVGKYHICGTCLTQLKKRGRLQVEPYSSKYYLLPSGEVVLGNPNLRESPRVPNVRWLK